MKKTQPKRARARRPRRRTPPGAPPVTLIVDPEAPRPVVTLIAYGPDAFVEEQIRDVRAVREHLGRWPVTWVNVDGLGDAQTLEVLGQIFDLHPLALEDVVNVHQRPKDEEYGRYHYVVARIATLGERLDTEQVSLFFGPGFVLTFQERPGDCFDPVRERIRKAHGRVREAGADYLAYALLDAIVDHYFPVIEQYGERVESLEDRVIERPVRETVAEIHAMKRDLLTLRRAIWPLRDALGSLMRTSDPFLSQETRVHLRDCHDHTIRIIDIIETDREIASGVMELYLSSLSHRMNEIMKVLTIIATIFIPLSFVAGVYGMNFNPDVSPWNMPELHWRYGYLFALSLMLLLGGGLVGYCWRKGWLRSRS